MRPLVVPAVLLAVAGVANGVDPRAFSGLKGSISDGTYTSPGGVFRVRVPPLAEPGAAVTDSAFDFGYQTVRFTDERCRYFVITRQTVTLEGLTLKDWTARRVISDLRRHSIAVTSEETATRHGPAIRLLYRRPRGAPCTAPETRDGEQTLAAPDANVAEYIFYTSGSLYRVTSVVGLTNGKAGDADPADKLAAGLLDTLELAAKSR